MSESVGQRRPWASSLSGLFGPDGPTLGEFVQETFTPWAQANRPRSAANMLEKLHRHFGSWFAEPLPVITVERIELWKQRRLNSGRKPTTVLRDLFALSSVLSRAVKIGMLPENPIRRVDRPRIDRRAKVRFLDEAEESRLREALMKAQPRRAVADAAVCQSSGIELVDRRPRARAERHHAAVAH